MFETKTKLDKPSKNGYIDQLICWISVYNLHAHNILAENSRL